MERSFLNRALSGAALSAVLVLTACLFRGSLGYEFVWDDKVYILPNPDVRTLSADGIIRLFIPSDRAAYKPLTLLSFALEYHLFGVRASVSRLINLGLHLANCLLAFGLVLAWSRKKSTAILACLLFAIHPLRVEPVVWISARKDLLSGFFMLAGLLAYEGYLEHRRKFFYRLCFFCFCVGIFAKSIGAVMPFLMLLADDRRGRLTLAAWREKLSLIFPAAVIALLSLYGDWGEVFVGTGLIQRAQVAVMSVGFYFQKFFWPAGLTAIYLYPEEVRSAIAECWWGILLAGFWIGLSVKARDKTRDPFFGLMFFLLPILVTLPRTSGDAGFFAADRYVYVSMLGLAYAVCRVLVGIFQPDGRWGAARRGALAAVGILIAGVFLKVSAEQIRVWTSGETLYRDMLRKYPKNYLAYNNLGLRYYRQGNIVKAREMLEAAVRLRPSQLKFRLNLALIYTEQQLYEKAEAEYLAAQSYYPSEPELLDHWGQFYRQRGLPDQALEKFKQAVTVNAGYAQAYGHMSAVYQQLGREDLAVENLMKAYKLNPRAFRSGASEGAEDSVETNY